jgi:3'-5' exonuclease
VDKTLLNKVLYQDEGLSDEEAHKKHLEELAKQDRDFVNPSFHMPVSMAVAAISDTLEITKIGLLGGKEATPGSITKGFWDVYRDKKPILVDFNGKGFDLRMMELWAFRCGITLPKDHFDKFGVRYKFAEDRHLDLHAFLTNHGAIRLAGGLNLFSKILGKPGKTSTKGEMVQELYDKGERFRIDDYCLSDVMDTYFIFLRAMVLMGQLTLPREKELVDAAKGKIEEHSAKEGTFKTYLEAFGYWESPL